MEQNPHPEPLPAIHHRYREDGWTPDVQRKFIHALAACGSVVEACRVANRSASSAYRLRANPAAQAFRDAWTAATGMAYRQVFDLAMDRAVLGVEQPVYHRGEQVGFKTTYSDRLICHLLDHLRPAAPKIVAAARHPDRHDYDLAAALNEIEPDPVPDSMPDDEVVAAADEAELAMMDWRDEVLGPPEAEPEGPTDEAFDAMSEDEHADYYRTGNYTVAPAAGGGGGGGACAGSEGGGEFLRIGVPLE